MAKIYLLTAPFDEDAKTGDGQYAASLETGFAQHYTKIPCVWLKKDDHKYNIPLPAGTESFPEKTIPSAIVLQPVANENTIISGYKLTTESATAEEAEQVNKQTVSPKTPKAILNPDNSLRSLTIMDIYSQKPIHLDTLIVKGLIESLNEKKTKLEEAIALNHEKMPRSQKAKIAFLVKTYRSNEGNIQSHCSLNEYIEAHIANKAFLTRHAKALSVFTALDKHFAGPVDLNALEKLADKLTGVRDYAYDFHSHTLPYDLENDKGFRNLYDLDGLKSSIEAICKKLKALSIRQRVIKQYPLSVHELSSEAELDDKLKLINLMYTGYAGEYSKEKFIEAFLESNPLDLELAANDEIEQALRFYTKIDKLLASKSNIVDKKAYRDKLLPRLQALLSCNFEPYQSVNSTLNSFYGKRKFSASEGFHLAYQANQRDPIKYKVIDDIIKSMQPIEKDTHLDIHIRPPDCGVFITAADIKKFQEAGIRVNITIHEYKQNYTRRYLQQYTHDLMRQANSVQFFNASDRDNAIIAATYGDCDKRNTTEPSGIEKKKREVGADFPLDKYPVQKYDLAAKSGLTVASQNLSTEPSHPKDVVAKPGNILSFGTIRPGKGFEEAYKLAQLIKEDADTIRGKIRTVPVVKLAGDPQDRDLMQKIVVERFGSAAVEAYQQVPSQAYKDSFTNGQRRDYWKNLVNALNKKVTEEAVPLNNPYIEIHPWCEPHELLALKENCKYVCRMDDMGMRNNGSAIISVLDVGIVYTKFGSVTDDIFLKGGKYGKAVDIGEHRYGKHSLFLKAEEYARAHKKEPLLLKSPDSAYKRQSESRDPKEILASIIAREKNQIDNAATIEESDNYQTVLEAQKLLTEQFTLKNATDHLLGNIGLGHLIAEADIDELAEVDPVQSQAYTLEELGDIPITPFRRSKSYPDLGFFGGRGEKELGLKTGQLSDNIYRVGQSVAVI
ncbi:Dot/Icm T4SS effector Ceg32/SidI [Legionella sp. km772]|uniref:Dot/Icm T4SS effector Ceg32/SidI n=1 Tax=Legionella sp. km772 TaxID=2498111 RepID=UPI000F8E1A32|nr:Dot/Icm T4SS effector Ceg32/SidI [Legionella sp. km772]RUR06901.1 hypothetical protein ELY15_12715 [Legionella sp. km772]